jgi:hypothetical protein
MQSAAYGPADCAAGARGSTTVVFPRSPSWTKRGKASAAQQLGSPSPTRVNKTSADRDRTGRPPLAHCNTNGYEFPVADAFAWLWHQTVVDDNRDDSYSVSTDIYSPKSQLSCLVNAPARSWQCEDPRGALALGERYQR